MKSGWLGRMKLGVICVLVLSCFGVSKGWAAERTPRNILDKRLTLYGGLQFYQAEGEFNSTEEGRPKIKVDLDDLGLEENTTSFIFGAIYKLGKRWDLRFDYFGYHEKSKVTAGFNFNFEDLVVPVGARIDSDLDLDLYVASLSYNFIHSEWEG